MKIFVAFNYLFILIFVSILKNCCDISLSRIFAFMLKMVVFLATSYGNLDEFRFHYFYTLRTARIISFFSCDIDMLTFTMV